VNSASTFFDIAHESWLATTTVFPVPPDWFEDPPPTEQAARAAAETARAVAAATARTVGMMLSLPIDLGGDRAWRSRLDFLRRC
jgi:hypothetical protein